MGRSQEGNRLSVLEKSLEAWLGVVFRYEYRIFAHQATQAVRHEDKTARGGIIGPSIGGQIVEEGGGMIDQVVR